MKKILVIGSGGSGKSVFARRLGKKLQIEVIHLDKFYWRPGWVETPKPEWLRIIGDLVQRDSWIMDGNYSGSLDVRIHECDTVIFLDLNRSLCLWRALKRNLMYRKDVRPDMAEGCSEKFSPEFYSWIWNYPKRSRPKVLKLLKSNSATKKIIRLRSTAEVERFLKDGKEPRCGPKPLEV